MRVWRRRVTEGAYLLGAALALDAACGEHLPQLLDLVGSVAEAEVEAEAEAEAVVEAEVEAEAGAAVAFAVAELVAVVAVAVADLHALAVDRALLLGQRAAEERRGEARAPQLERHFLDTRSLTRARRSADFASLTGKLPMQRGSRLGLRVTLSDRCGRVSDLRPCVSCLLPTYSII